MTREQAKHFLPLIKALAEGKQIQMKGGSGHWNNNDWPDWSAGYYNYRIKPEPTYRPWKPEEVPVGAWIRNKDKLVAIILWSNQTRFGWLTGRSSVLEQNCSQDNVCFEDALTCISKLEHSLDQGKTWSPCGVLVEG